MKSRREFLLSTGASLLALPFARASAAPSVRRDSLDRIGLQLYTVRSEMEKDVERTLAEVAKIGYHEVEFAGYFGKSPKEIRAILDASGLTAPSSHAADFGTMRGSWRQALDDAAVVGHRYLVCASIPRRERADLDGWKRVAELFNQSGESAKQAGFRFAFHNHAEEFAPVGNTTGYDILLAETDPALVGMQLDLFWIVRAGRDPLAYFAAHRNRFVSVHVKDMAAGGRMADVGAGTLPFAQYFAAAKRAGVQHYFVEHDQPADPIASIRASHDYLKRLQF
jgi:sugar phosphate isomerase/epimerase